MALGDQAETKFVCDPGERDGMASDDSFVEPVRTHDGKKGVPKQLEVFPRKRVAGPASRCPAEERALQGAIRLVQIPRWRCLPANKMRHLVGKLAKPETGVVGRVFEYPEPSKRRTRAFDLSRRFERLEFVGLTGEELLEVHPRHDRTRPVRDRPFSEGLDMS